MGQRVFDYERASGNAAGMKVIVRVDSRLRIAKNQLSAIEVMRLRAAFTYPNQQKATMKHLQKARPWLWKGLPDEEVSWEETRASETFPRGGMAKVVKVLELSGREVEEQDERVDVPHGYGPPLQRALWPHQEEGVRAALENQQGIIKAATGSGKTSTMLALVARANQTCLVVMNSAKLLDQWEARAEKELGLSPREIGKLGGGEKKDRPFTLAIVNTAAKLVADRGFAREWGMVLVDEVHQASATMFRTVVDAMPARYRIGASADQRRKDKREYLIHDAFGAVLHEAGTERMVAEKRVLDVQVKLHRTAFEAPWYGSPADQQLDWEAAGKDLDFVRLLEEMSRDEARNALAVRIAAMEAAAGHTVIMFVHLREHAQALVRMLTRMAWPAGLLIGGAGSSEEYDRTIAGMRAGTTAIGVGTYKAAGTGMDIPRLAVAVAVTPCLTNRTIFQQGRGRLSRVDEGKTAARMHVLWDSTIFPHAPKRALEYNNHAEVQTEAGTWEHTERSRRRATRR